jgi:uncharacterized lipoprotein YddW (UPF0748 family)
MSLEKDIHQQARLAKKILFPLLLLCGSVCFAQPKYEFRAAWIASVTHIDWPSPEATGNVVLQKQEFVHLLDMLQRDGLNAVVVQIRPTADAFFPSPYEPWSVWLTGKQGVAPNPYYDPLAFMIAETHKRGMEFHAWINPYRALYNSRKDIASADHITRVHPEWFLVYDNTTEFNPGIPAVWDYVTNIVRDIVRRYDVDAIHFDDYFYPYKTQGEYFADDNAYAEYNRGLDKETWRRSNVDSLILKVSRAIKEEKPWCKFGISPYGVWRNLYQDSTGSQTTSHQTDYDDLYANIMLWLQKGWIDYVCPQLYWERGHRVVPYDVLLDWWSRHTYDRQLYIGIGLYKAGTNPAWKNRSELPIQVAESRGVSQGCVFFSAANFMDNPLGWCDSLRENYYRYPALVPPMPWIDTTQPPAPQVEALVEGDSVHVTLSASDSLPLRLFVVYRYLTGDADTALDPVHIYKILPADGGQGRFNLAGRRRGRRRADADEKIRWAVTAVSRANVEGPAATF